MASYYEALPIYRAALDTAVAVDRAVQKFDKGHKYTLGAQLRTAGADILIGVARGNRRDGRAASLAALCDRIEELKLLLHLAKEVQAFQSFSAYAQVVQQVVGLARQAEGGRRSAASPERPEPERSVPGKGRP